MKHDQFASCVLLKDVNQWLAMAHLAEWHISTGNKAYVQEIDDEKKMIRLEVASSRSDYLPTLSAAKTSKLSLLIKHHILAIDEAS